MPIPPSRFPRFCVYFLVALGLLGTSQPSFGYRWRGWLSPSDWNVDFGGRPVGAATTLPEVFTNAGRYPIAITSANLAGSGFTLSAPAFPLTLDPGESVTFDVIFEPTAGADYSGSLTVAWGRYYGRTLNILITGTGAGAGSVSAVPGNLSFGNVTVGASLTKTGKLTAAGASATISSVTTTNPEFTVSGMTLPLTLSAEQSVSFAVKFSPQSAGTASASLSFAANGTGAVAAQALSGTGSAAPAPHSVSLSWQDSTADVAGYNIYRGATSGGPYTQVNSTAEAGNSYTDTAVGSGTRYFYVVTAVDGTGAESEYSAEVTAAIPTP